MTNFNILPDYKYQQFEAERKEYRSRQEQPFAMIEESRFTVTSDDIRERMVYELRAFLLNREVKEEKETDTQTRETLICKSWWDHLKWTFQLWLSERGKWASKWRLHLIANIEMSTITTTTNITKTFHMCPHLQTDDRTTHYRWLQGDIVPPVNFERFRP